MPRRLIFVYHTIIDTQTVKRNTQIVGYLRTGIKAESDPDPVHALVSTGKADMRTGIVRVEKTMNTDITVIINEFVSNISIDRDVP